MCSCEMLSDVSNIRDMLVGDLLVALVIDIGLAAFKKTLNKRLGIKKTPVLTPKNTGYV